MFSSWVLTVAPWRKQQEISCYQSCRHDHGSQLLQLFDVHPGIVTLLCLGCSFGSRMVKLTNPFAWFSRLVVGIEAFPQFQAETGPENHCSNSKSMV